MLGCCCYFSLPMNLTRHRTRDWLWASLTALGLTGVAVLVFLVIHPGGFEGAGYWLIVYLPGALVGFVAADHIYKAAPLAEPVVFWTLTIGFSFAWYFSIFYVVIRSVRFVVNGLRS
jgi:hypothetical protein